MESLNNKNNTENINENTFNEQKFKTVDDYVSVFNHDFLSTLQTKITALLVNNI